LRTRAIPERFCGGDSLQRGAISSACTFTFHLYSIYPLGNFSAFIYRSLRLTAQSFECSISTTGELKCPNFSSNYNAENVCTSKRNETTEKLAEDLAGAGHKPPRAVFCSAGGESRFDFKPLFTGSLASAAALAQHLGISVSLYSMSQAAQLC